MFNKTCTKLDTYLDTSYLNHSTRLNPHNVNKNCSQIEFENSPEKTSTDHRLDPVACP